MINFILVFVGGGLGSMARYGISRIVTQSETSFPWATFTANAISCIILGVLLGIQIKNGISENNKLLFMTGFCGGFSTFSTFSAEAFNLFHTNNIGLAFLYIGGSIILCLICIYLGIKLSYLS